VVLHCYNCYIVPYRDRRDQQSARFLSTGQGFEWLFLVGWPQHSVVAAAAAAAAGYQLLLLLLLLLLLVVGTRHHLAAC
jgi:hypothetical protein